MNEIFVDFNLIGPQKLAYSISKLAKNPETLNVGDRLLATDHEDVSCYATVTKIWNDGVVELELDI